MRGEQSAQRGEHSSHHDQQLSEEAHRRLRAALSQPSSETGEEVETPLRNIPQRSDSTKGGHHSAQHASP